MDTADQIDDHLFARLIPAVLEQHPPARREYTAETVTRWLTTLACHLTRQGAHGGSSSDLELHQLWPAAGRHAPRYIAAALMTTVAITPCLVFAALNGWWGSPEEWTVSEILSWISVALIGAIILGAVLGSVFGIAGGLAGALATLPPAIDRPSRLVRQGLVHLAAVTVAVGLLIGLEVALIRIIQQFFNGRWQYGLVTMLVYGLVLAFLLGLPVGLPVVAKSPWPRYLVTTLILARRGDLPRRPAVFLDWAYGAGLMRLSGIAVQFRHREFQTWLAARGRPVNGHATSVVHTDLATDANRG